MEIQLEKEKLDTLAKAVEDAGLYAKEKQGEIHRSYKSDGSVIEMVVDGETAPNSWWGSNGLIWNGNFNNYDKFKGQIKRVGKKKIIEREVDISKWFPKLEIEKRPYLIDGLFLNVKHGFF